MYAVVRTGGKQYRLSQGDMVEVEQLSGDVGSEIELSEVLVIGGDSFKIGDPVVSGATVKCKIMAQTKGPKIDVFKKKRRKSYSRKIGHRQPLTRLRIIDINPGA